MTGEDKVMSNPTKEFLPIVIIFTVITISCFLDYLAQNSQIAVIESSVLEIQNCVAQRSCNSEEAYNNLNSLYQKLLDQPKRWVATRHSKLLKTIGSINQQLINNKTNQYPPPVNNLMQTDLLTPPSPLFLARPDPPPDPPPVPDPPPPSIVRRSEGVIRGSALGKITPDYPQLAKTAHIEGSVVVEITISEEGNVISARVVSGHPLLQQAALSAAKKWIFRPTLLDNTAVKVTGVLTFRFNL